MIPLCCELPINATFIDNLSASSDRSVNRLTVEIEFFIECYVQHKFYVFVRVSSIYTSSRVEFIYFLFVFDQIYNECLNKKYISKVC